MASADWRNLPLRGAGGADTADRRAAIPVETPYVQERWELVAYVNSTVVDSVAQPAARYSDVSGALNDVYGLSRLSTAGGTAEILVAATYLQDGLGSVSAVLDASGAVVASYSYSPWGEVSGGAGELPAYGYNAEEATVAAGLQYLRARWYDPAGASFASRDTYLGDAPDLASLNRYAYAQGNPVAYSDPAGRAAWLKSASKTVLSAAGKGNGKLTYNRLSGSLLDPTLKRTGQKASCFTQGLPTDAHVGAAAGGLGQVVGARLLVQVGGRRLRPLGAPGRPGGHRPGDGLRRPARVLRRRVVPGCGRPVRRRGLGRPGPRSPGRARLRAGPGGRPPTWPTACGTWPRATSWTPACRSSRPSPAWVTPSARARPP